MKVFPSTPQISNMHFPPHPKSENQGLVPWLNYSASYIFPYSQDDFQDLRRTVQQQIICLVLHQIRKGTLKGLAGNMKIMRGGGGETDQRTSQCSHQAKETAGKVCGEGGWTSDFYYFYHRTVFQSCSLSSSSITLELSQNAQFEKLCIHIFGP